MSFGFLKVLWKVAPFSYENVVWLRMWWVVGARLGGMSGRGINANKPCPLGFGEHLR